jgi:hypothetical protein
MTAWVNNNEKLILSKAGEWAEKLFVGIQKIGDNMPQILTYVELIGKGLVAWGAFTLTAKTMSTAIGGISFALNGAQVAMNAIAAFQAGGMLAALGSIAKALLGIQTGALAAAEAVAAVGTGGIGAAIGAVALPIAAGAIAVGAAAKGYSNMEESAQEATHGGRSFMQLWGDTLRRHYIEGKNDGLDGAAKAFNDSVSHKSFEDGIAGFSSPKSETYGYVEPTPMTPVPQAMPQAEAQHRLTEQRTTNVQRSEVVLKTDRGVQATTKKRVPGVVIMPATGGIR